MKLDSIRFLRSGNVVSSHSGAVIRLSGLDPAIRIAFAQLIRWLACLHTTLRFPPGQPDLSLVEGRQDFAGCPSVNMLTCMPIPSPSGCSPKARPQ